MNTHTPLILQAGIIEATLWELRRSGDRNSEGIVLWLGRRTPDQITVVEAYVPDHVATSDFFRIPPSAMDALFGHLGQTGNFVAAQVHSHPREAFHSQADDEWAIVRHVNALSVVVPNFACRTTPATLLEDVAVFRLSAVNQWVQLDRSEIGEALRLS